MKKAFLVSILLLGLALSFGVLAQEENANTIGASPCGTKAKPAEVSSPVRFSVRNIGASYYAWGIGSESFQTPENSVERNVPVGSLNWSVTARSATGELFFANCVIKVTEIIPPGTVRIQNPLKANNLTELIDIILNFIFNIAFVVAPIMVILAGFLFVTGGGNPAQLEKARNLLIWTVIGFGIILISRGIPFVLKDILGIQ